MASKEYCRPDPDELLRRIQTEEERDCRGRLKIFLGYAPRVGKSLRMFDEGRRRKVRGQDVVVGAIQSKGAGDFEHLIGEFEIITGIDAILARHPQVCLIDELAKVNPPGSRHGHRWQDVEELRAHGINVVAAINLQHIAEQQDAVERITGRRACDFVPQCFIESADEIVIVDVPPEQLAQHDAPAGALSAAQLSELREVALLLAAQVVEHQLQIYMDAHGIMQSWGTQERILVCLTSRGSARDMVASGARTANRFHGQLLAVTVKSHELQREDEETLEENLEYARKLGAEVHVLTGSDPIAEIMRFAREQRITQVFIGHTQRSTWKFWEPNPVDRLIQAAEGMDVRIFPHTSSPAPAA
jgi:two-component system sensor histidine kinase KdpD